MLAQSFHWCGSFKEGERWQKAAPSCASLVSNGPSHGSKRYCESKDYRVEQNSCKSDWFNVLVRKPNKIKVVASNTIMRSDMHAVLGRGKVADILSWKNKTLSGGILGGVTVLWVLFELTEYSLATFFCHILMLLMITLFTWSKSAGLIKRNPPTSNEIRLPESAFRFFFDQINETILTFYRTSTGQKGLKTFFVTLAGLYILSFIGSLFSTMTFAYLVFACCATIPAFYEQNKMQVHEIFGHSYREINNSLKDFRSKLVDKIPRGKDD
ncbi:PREDICTED: reticulon-like protein B14 [Populus euphratica]|uniref:Reticulon-like protein n=1 Tax=Populus euphratica TaxID=75702 RepID=A0AAJ6UET6_POPEU|nr:PREDICTED: reticulon-like protein B14 [Populus euphratica]